MNRLAPEHAPDRSVGPNFGLIDFNAISVSLFEEDVMHRKRNQFIHAAIGLVTCLGFVAAGQGAVLLNLTDSAHFSGEDAGAGVSPGQQVGSISGSA